MLKEETLNREPPVPASRDSTSSAPRRSQSERVQDWSGTHPVDIRLTLPLLSGRYYLTVLAGRERRSAERLRADRARHPLFKFGNVVLILLFGTLVGLALLSTLQLLSYWILL